MDVTKTELRKVINAYVFLRDHLHCFHGEDSAMEIIDTMTEMLELGTTAPQMIRPQEPKHYGQHGALFLNDPLHANRLRMMKSSITPTRSIKLLKRVKSRHTTARMSHFVPPTQIDYHVLWQH